MNKASDRFGTNSETAKWAEVQIAHNTCQRQLTFTSFLTVLYVFVEAVNTCMFLTPLW